MCGIAGIIQQDPNNHSLRDIKKMTDAISHRGPDGEAAWQNRNMQALLGHRRLSIIDLSSAADQPIHYHDRYSIIHNGEIYNYIELKEELIRLDYSFKSQTDTEVIVAAYDHWGPDCLEKFDGMFAFAIWDEARQELFAARDRFGEKPFFFSKAKGKFLFASEMKALWAAGTRKIPNQKLLFNFLTIGYTDNPEIPSETFFEEISKLPPAAFLVYDLKKDSLEIINYWDIDIDVQNKSISTEKASEEFLQLFHDSVKKRLRSDVPLGISLSGGVDSTSICAMAGQSISSSNTGKSFTAVFEGFERDEKHYAKLAADHFQLQHFFVNISAADLLNDWKRFCSQQEEPAGSASAYAQFKVFELAKQNDVKVLLDGQGADEILAGYPKYYKWYWQELYRKGKLFKSRELENAINNGVRESFTFKNRLAAWFPGFTSIVMERQYLLKAIKQEDLSKEFVQLQSREAYYTPPEHFTLNGVLYFNTRVHGLEELLRYADRNSMAHGRETRLPFLSHQLVEFLFSLPSSFKIRKGWTKWLLRNSMESLLPGEICWRKEKIGFEPPQKSWMENAAVQEAIHSAKTKLVGEKVLKPSVLDKKIRPMNAHDANNYDWRYFSAASIFE
jgi:asparagine synthase (glutamine-hydrolysing)